MFERFTDRSRRILVLAQEEARLEHAHYIGTEHLLLGLIHEGEGVGATVLQDLGVELDQVRKAVAARPPRVDLAGPVETPPFTPRSKKVLELALREALQLGHNYIGTEHILLGLIREGEGIAAEVLVNDCNLSLSQIRSAVIQKLSGYTQAPLATPRTPAFRSVAMLEEERTEMLDWIQNFDQTNGPLAKRHILARMRERLSV